jgi:hypothetical protein
MPTSDPIASAFNIKALFSSTISPWQIVITLALAFAAGIFIYLIYRWTFAGVMYSRSFNLSLILLTMVTSMVIMLITTNLTLSLGMVGALSIVRFRTAVKDPIDTVFMFWAVGEGIALGAKFYDVGFFGALVIGFIMVLLNFIKVKGSMPYLLILHYHEGATNTIKQLVRQLPNCRLKSKTVQRDGVELTMEIRVRESETGFVDKFLKVEGVYDATLVSHQGDIIS